ncbi:hypothetical protein EO92_13390 [Methanosarcina sp. 2.H.A.1B.4]|nr:hypothetical protein EO92_13390 [Methanosarcina sp. 2.H.A.1B.4]
MLKCGRNFGNNTTNEGIMDLITKLAIITIIVSIIFGIPNCISAYYARKAHNKKNQDFVIHEERVLDAKSKVKKVLLGFCNDWKSYSNSKELYSNEDPEYIAFICVNHRLEYHLDQFNLVSNEISDLPIAVSDKLLEFVSQIRIMIGRSNIVDVEVWSRKYPSSLVNQFDELLADVMEMYANLDEICSITKKA